MTDLIEVNTAALSGEALGWAVGKAQGLDLHLEPPQYGNGWRVFAIYRGDATERCERYDPWSSWELGGPLIQSQGVSLHCPQHDGDCWAAWITKDGKDVAQGGGLVLPAACRAIVAHELGDTVQVPKELLP